MRIESSRQFIVECKASTGAPAGKAARFAAPQTDHKAVILVHRVHIKALLARLRRPCYADFDE